MNNLNKDPNDIGLLAIHRVMNLHHTQTDIARDLDLPASTINK